MRIQNNIPAINAHRNYTINARNLSKSVERLSSGFRINRAGDDAAGLAISEKMRAQIRGLMMASKNSQDAISMIQTAEGALQSTHNILQRMRELAVQAASDTNQDEVDREALELEFRALIAEINDTADKTAFNDQKLIDGTFAKQLTEVNTKYNTGFAMDKDVTLNGKVADGTYTFTAGVETITAEGAAATTAKAKAWVDNTGLGDIKIEVKPHESWKYDMTDGNNYDVTFSTAKVQDGKGITFNIQIDGDDYGADPDAEPPVDGKSTLVSGGATLSLEKIMEAMKPAAEGGKDGQLEIDLTKQVGIKVTLDISNLTGTPENILAAIEKGWNDMATQNLPFTTQAATPGEEAGSLEATLDMGATHTKFTASAKELTGATFDTTGKGVAEGAYTVTAEKGTETSASAATHTASNGGIAALGSTTNTGTHDFTDVQFVLGEGMEGSKFDEADIKNFSFEDVSDGTDNTAWVVSVTVNGVKFSSEELDLSSAKTADFSGDGMELTNEDGDKINIIFSGGSKANAVTAGMADGLNTDLASAEWETEDDGVDYDWTASSSGSDIRFKINDGTEDSYKVVTTGATSITIGGVKIDFDTDATDALGGFTLKVDDETKFAKESDHKIENILLGDVNVTGEAADAIAEAGEPGALTVAVTDSTKLAFELNFSDADVKFKGTIDTAGLSPAELENLEVTLEDEDGNSITFTLSGTLDASKLADLATDINDGLTISLTPPTPAEGDDAAVFEATITAQGSGPINIINKGAEFGTWKEVTDEDTGVKTNVSGGVAEIGAGAAYNGTYTVKSSGETQDDFKLWLEGPGEGQEFSSITSSDLKAWLEGDSDTLTLKFSGMFGDTPSDSGSVGFINLDVDRTVLDTVDKLIGGLNSYFNNGVAKEIVFSGGRDADTTHEINVAVTNDKGAEFDNITLRVGDTGVTSLDAGIRIEFGRALTKEDIENPDDLFNEFFGAFNEGTVTVSSKEGNEFVVQSGANKGDETTINIDKMDAGALGIQFSSIASQKKASNAIEEVNNALNAVSMQRAALGALQNRMEFKIENLETSAENLMAAESRIRDADMAKEMTDFMRRNILFQASVAMLAQANSLPQAMLQMMG